MAIGIICLAVLGLIVGSRIGEFLAQVDALSEYAETINNNLNTLIERLNLLTPEEKQQLEDSRKDSPEE